MESKDYKGGEYQLDIGNELQEAEGHTVQRASPVTTRIKSMINLPVVDEESVALAKKSKATVMDDLGSQEEVKAPVIEEEDDDGFSFGIVGEEKNDPGAEKKDPIRFFEKGVYTDIFKNSKGHEVIVIMKVSMNWVNTPQTNRWGKG